jgi:lipopolysaccharide/colanic/teichoic acid biosynthesis glycosyltransferase
MRRLLDVLVSIFGLVIFSPVLAVLCFLVWLQDRHSPFYIPNRVGRGGRLYRMVKLRSMVVRADKNRVDSTANNDPRITPIGRFIRGIKFDEFPQLWNVLRGEMSLVGPRPNVQRETDLYTTEEKSLLSVAPGITDMASIVFADEGSILENRADPDLAYNQLIRPWKSRLGLLYVQKTSVGLNVYIVLLTVLAAVRRQAALDRVAHLVSRLGGSAELATVCRRLAPLEPAAPPGMNDIVRSREIMQIPRGG